MPSKFVRCLTISIFAAGGLVASPLHAWDDPLNAFPTSEYPVEERVEGLTRDQLQAIELPSKTDQLVFSVSQERGFDSRLYDTRQAAQAADPEPWLSVFADGRIRAANIARNGVQPAEDRLSPPELKWLLHLAVNECGVLTLSTEQIEEKYLALGRELPPQNNVDEFVRFYVHVKSGSNNLSIPDRALFVRPLRSKMELLPFASLKKYYQFLTIRANAGNAETREKIREEVNRELRAKDPNALLFRKEHLVSSYRFPEGFGVGFHYEVPLPGVPNTRSVEGSYLVQEGKEPTIRIDIKDLNTRRGAR